MGYFSLPPLLPLPLLHTVTATIPLSLKSVINSPLLPQKLYPTGLVRFIREEEITTFAYKTAIGVTRSGGPKLLKALPNNCCTILPPPSTGIPPPSCQCLLSHVTKAAEANCGKSFWTGLPDWSSSFDWSWCNGSSGERLRRSRRSAFG